MAPDVAPIERLEDRPISVDPAAIEDEFSRIWRETSGAGFDESSIRLRVVNFVGLAYTDEGTGRFEEVMARLPQRHPCRGLLAVSAAEYLQLDATIAAHCWRSAGGGRHVCSEEVILHGGVTQEPELASAVLALLVPEVPVAAWFIDAFEPGGYFAAELVDAAATVFFDSAAAPAPGAAFALALATRDAHDVALADLAWGRTETWRELIAQMFDGADGPRELDAITSIEVRGGEGAASAEPLLLGAWFVSRLGLALADVERSDGTLAAALYDGTRAVRLRVVPGAQAVEEVLLRTADAEFQVQCHAESGHMHVRESWDSGASRRTVQQMDISDGAVIMRALDGVSDGGVYAETLHAALALLGE